MNNFEEITKNPETLGAFLRGLPVIEAPWDEEFQRSRANMFCSPFFLLALDRKAEENAGDVLFGTIGWTGNYRFTFEVDNENGLRVLSGINPYASEYSLKPNEVFRTPEFIFTYSTEVPVKR